MLPEPSAGPRCGTCGSYFSPGQVFCAACGAHRYGPEKPVVGPLAQRSVGQTIQAYIWWVIAGVGLVICTVLGLVFGLLDFLLHLLPH